jgi:hypothetical protein
MTALKKWTLFLVVAMFTTTLLSPPANAHHKSGPCAIHWQRPYYEHHDIRPVKRLIRCAVRHWPVIGGVRKALDVARCESGYRPDADGGSSEGVYQHVNTYWPGRAERFLRDRWHIGHSIWNARAQVIVTVRMVRSGGWSPWSCA